MCLDKKRGIYQIQCLVPPSINIKPLFHIRDGAGLAPFCMCSSLASPQATTPRRAKEKKCSIVGCGCLVSIFPSLVQS
ncbi:hypothetical protein J3E69DRAFT_343351 [Trichoderma sp. SZMC 28015]